MKEISADEFWQIVNNMPKEMQLPMYMGERDGKSEIKDLAKWAAWLSVVNVAFRHFGEFSYR